MNTRHRETASPDTSTDRASTAPLAIVTVTYSPGEHLRAFVESVAAGTQQDTLIVLADNGSTDGVPQAAAHHHEHVEFFPTGGNLGYGSGVNAAVRALRDKRESGEVRDDFFIISNPDVVFEEGAIDALLDCALRWPNAASTGPRIQEPDGSIYPSARAVPGVADGIGHALLGRIWPTNPWTQRYLSNEDMDSERTAGWLSGSCLLVRWEAFTAVGGFDERYFMYMEDVDLGDRFQRAGYVNVYCPDAVITHAQGHSTDGRAESMLPAHHESAYRFQADRLTKPYHAPLRWMIWAGLKIRGKLAVASARRAKEHARSSAIDRGDKS